MSDKKIAVRYFTKSGNTRKLAEAIASEAGVEAVEIPADLDEFTDVLFLGASVYWGGVDGKVKEFVRSLDASKIGEVAVFSTSALAERALPQLKKELSKRGIKVADHDFYCRGQFKALHKGRPNEQDIAQAREFVKTVLQ
jgi:flavodoxin